ncbi:MAG: hypothetical protein GY758_00995 [Fuerstiella sp.]|nr:hypothetical protein [Fuerstiella sp.]
MTFLQDLGTHFDDHIMGPDSKRRRHERGQAMRDRKRLLEPMAAASLSDDPVEFMRSFAGAAGKPALQESLGAAMASGDAGEREAGGLFGQALQNITPAGQKRQFDAQVQAQFEQRTANAKIVQEENKRKYDMAQTQRLGDFTNFEARAAAVGQVRGNVRGHIAAQEIMDIFQDTGEGTFTIPTEQRGRLKLKRTRLIQSLMQAYNTGVLTPGELEYLDSIVDDPTKLSSNMNFTAQQMGELQEFQRMLRDNQEDNQFKWPGLHEEMPNLFEIRGPAAAAPPPGFAPR